MYTFSRNILLSTTLRAMSCLAYTNVVPARVFGSVRLFCSIPRSQHDSEGGCTEKAPRVAGEFYAVYS